MKRLFLHITLFCVCLKVSAQIPDCRMTIGKRTLLIGEQTELKIEVSTDSSSSAEFPEFGDTLTNLVEILDVSRTKREKEDDVWKSWQTLTITSFDSGSFQIPSVPIIINDSITLNTNSLTLNIQTVEVDTSKEFKDIKPIVTSIPNPVPEENDSNWLWWLLLLIPIGALVYYLIRKKKKPAQEVIKPKPSIPPHIVATNALSRLEEQKLWQNGEIKKYHSELSDIVRTYIQSRFEIPAMEQTSNELIRILNTSYLNEDLHQKLKQILLLADQVKFAKGKPIGPENELSMAHARSIIDNTKQVAEPGG